MAKKRMAGWVVVIAAFAIVGALIGGFFLGKHVGALEFRFLKEVTSVISANHPDRDFVTYPAEWPSDDYGYGFLKNKDKWADAVSEDMKEYFINKGEAEDGRETGYIGIGVRVDFQENTGVVITGVYRDSPAAKAGLKIGDAIIAVNGVRTTFVAEDFWNASKDVRENKGVSATLLVRSQSDDQLRLMKVTSDWVGRNEIFAEVEGERALVVMPERISEKTVTEFLSFLVELESRFDVKFLVIDLRGSALPMEDVRDYPASASHAIGMISAFLPANTPVTKEQQKNSSRILSTTGEVLFTKPVILLVDKSTEGGTELFAGVLQAYERAEVAGEYTAAHGSVQELLPITHSDFYQYAYMTTVVYHLPLSEKEGRKYAADGRGTDGFKDYSLNSNGIFPKYRTVNEALRDLGMK